MTRDRSRSRAARNRPWSPAAMLLACLLLALSLITVGCGDDNAATATTTFASGSGEPSETTVASTGSDAEDVAKMGGAELATATITAWNDCLTRLTALLEGMPEPASIQPAIEDLKEEYVQRFVAYGRQHQTFDDEQLRLWRIEHGINSPKAFAGYQEIANKYIMNPATPAGFVDLLKDFSILTQYTDFELLKQQEPDEAARLGIE